MKSNDKQTKLAKLKKEVAALLVEKRGMTPGQAARKVSWAGDDKTLSAWKRECSAMRKDKRMKKFVFGYVCTSRKVSRMYGGSDYTLTVYELTGGKVVRIGETTRCTRGHKGEDSEAWTVVLNARPRLAGILKSRIEAANKEPVPETITNYWRWQYSEHGVELHNLGGC